jgi:Tol biopolymer transport system component/predicted Ser/Thr protein kinase
MPLTIGSQLGSHEITALLGKGGMGEVYRARDLKLKREVAIKILPDEFARDDDRVSRFQREAEVLASLNHPNIAAIYDFEEANGSRFLVLELVDGETLADRLKRGPIPIDEALEVAKRICEALEAAHEKGIVHRDLKPANVKVTTDGKVKVLDFGIAKALGNPTPVDPANSPTVTGGATQPGIVMGTAAYMSPEQASGKSVDKRTDVWSFGVLLYELLTGKRAFDGKTVSHTIVHILENEPDWSALPPLPSGVQDVLERCLQKDPANRLRDIGDIRVLLQSGLTKSVRAVEGRATKTDARVPLKWVWLLGACVLLVVGVLAFYYSRQKPAAPEAMRFEIAQPANITTTNILVISPDGRRLAFIASVSGQTAQIWIRSLETLEARPLEGTTGVAVGPGSPFWSPDSRFLIFVAQGKLKKIDVAGGPALSLCDAPPGFFLGGFWNRDDKIIFADQRGLFQVASSGGTPAPLKLPLPSSESAAVFPSALPDGRHLLFSSASGIYVGSLELKEPAKQILPDSSPTTYVPTADPHLGYILFVRGLKVPALLSGTLMVQAIRPDSLTPIGEATPIAEQVAVSGFSASSTGVLVYGTGQETSPIGIPGMVQGQLTWFDRTGNIISTVGEPGVYRVAALSPDNKRAALESVDRQTRNLDIWIFEFARGVNSRFTFDPGWDIDPVWSPDGNRLVWVTGAPPTWQQKAANMTGGAEAVFRPPQPATPHSWSPDGKYVLSNDTTTPAHIWAVDVSLPAAGRKLIPLVNSGYNDVSPRFSPDGKWFSYASNQSGISEIYVEPFNPSGTGSSAAGGKWMVSKRGGLNGGAVWRTDGKELFYISPDHQMMSVEILPGSTFLPQTPKPLFKVPAGVFFFDVDKDGKRFLMPVPQAAGASTPPYKIILNWTSTLNK